MRGVRGECADECAGDLAEATSEFNGVVGLGCRDSLCKSMGIRAELKHAIALTYYMWFSGTRCHSTTRGVSWFELEDSLGLLPESICLNRRLGTMPAKKTKIEFQK